MNNTPCVSICIPTYNRARYLDSLLSSLADSLTEFPHSFEVVVADNCSEDNTQDVVARPIMDMRSRLALRYSWLWCERARLGFCMGGAMQCGIALVLCLGWPLGLHRCSLPCAQWGSRAGARSRQHNLGI